MNASESIDLVNGSLVAESSGNAGNVRISSGRLFIQGDNAGIFAGSRETGDAGNIEITARSIQLDNGGQLRSDSSSGKGSGNITLRNLDLLQMRDNSKISTNAEGTGMGGNINIDTDLLIGQENSDITATAVESRGGNIAINTQGIFGIEPRNSSTSESDITAVSDLGIDGIVEINRLDINPSSGLISLPTEIVDSTRLIAQGCGAGRGDVATSKFTATGRGGLPPNAMEALRSDSPLVDLGTAIQGKGDGPSRKAEHGQRANRLRRSLSQRRHRAQAIASTNLNPETAPTQLVEAQGWIIDANGKVVFTTQSSTLTHNNPWLTAANCHQPQTSS